MSMLGTRLGTAIWTAVKAQETYSPGISPADDAKGLALWQAIATMIVLEITVNAEVPALGLLDGTSAPVTGEAKVI